jgi:Zn-finger nucleic acid-binding protein
MIELQLKKASLDQKVASQNQELDNTPVGSGQALDRNELLKILNVKTSDK